MPCAYGSINKDGLVHLLRKHPNWNEEALAIPFEITVNRAIESAEVMRYREAVCRLGRDLPSEQYCELDSALREATRPLSRSIPSKECAERIEAACRVRCKVGQKVSRVINKVCATYKLDAHPEYNARFAQLADSLSPLLVKRKVLLSLHPCDYLEMSNKSNSWSSCHCLEDGSYRAGTLSYMLDRSSLILYSVEDDYGFPFYSVPKTSRELFCYQNGILLQSRLYPNTNDDVTKALYRNLVQQTLAFCLNVPNLWKLKKGSSNVELYVRTDRNALHYPDYRYEEFGANVSLLETVHQEDGAPLTVGTTAPCLCCTDTLEETSALSCHSCDGWVTCANCGGELRREDSLDLEDGYFCDSCASYCPLCDTYTSSELVSARRADGSVIDLCQDCFDERTLPCTDCGEVYMKSAVTESSGHVYCNTCLEAHQVLESTPA